MAQNSPQATELHGLTSLANTKIGPFSNGGLYFSLTSAGLRCSVMMDGHMSTEGLESGFPNAASKNVLPMVEGR